MLPLKHLTLQSLEQVRIVSSFMLTALMTPERACRVLRRVPLFQMHRSPLVIAVTRSPLGKTLQ
uniref:Uncharacterized protein n=1 Tax=Babesia bovis TaxID=5865 RepID=S6BKW0_BABBO|nr:hypothetical protein [Babesia bovis]